MAGIRIGAPSAGRHRWNAAGGSGSPGSSLPSRCTAGFTTLTRFHKRVAEAGDRGRKYPDQFSDGTQCAGGIVNRRLGQTRDARDWAQALSQPV